MACKLHPRVIKLALQLADEDAASTIDGMTAPVDGGWHEVDPNDKTYYRWVKRAVEYLEMRGKLRRRRSNPNHIKVIAVEVGV